MPESGNTIFIWQEQESPDVWATIAAITPQVPVAMPLVSRDPRLMNLMSDLAKAHGEKSGRDVRLVKFDLAEVVEYVEAPNA